MNLELDPFYILMVSSGKHYKMLVTQTLLNDSFERFTIAAGNRSIVLQSNRPALRATNSVRRIKLQLHSGEFNSKKIEALAWTINLVEKEIIKSEAVKNHGESTRS